MKRMITLAVCLIAATALFAQPQRPGEEQRKKDFERIKAEKIAFITSELDLSPEEAQVFWPVYNQCWKETLDSHRKMMEAYDAIRCNKTEGLSDKELEARLDAYIAAYKANSQVLVDWYPKFRSVLPVRKVAKLYEAEEAFQKRMLENLRKHPGKPQGNPQGTK